MICRIELYSGPGGSSDPPASLKAEHLTRLTKAMGRPLNRTQQLQAEGRTSRQETLDAILDCLTSDAIPSEVMREAALVLVYFEPKILAEIDRIGRSYDSPKEREVKVALLLGIALKALEKLV
jgi:hypothetical protein